MGDGRVAQVETFSQIPDAGLRTDQGHEDAHPGQVTQHTEGLGKVVQQCVSVTFLQHFSDLFVTFSRGHLTSPAQKNG